MIDGQLEAATDAFVKGATHLSEQGVELSIIVNALIGAAITCCYVSRQPPDALKKALRDAANQVPSLYERQDQIEKRSKH